MARGIWLLGTLLFVAMQACESASSDDGGSGGAQTGGTASGGTDSGGAPASGGGSGGDACLAFDAAECPSGCLSDIGHPIDEEAGCYDETSPQAFGCHGNTGCPGQERWATDEDGQSWVFLFGCVPPGFETGSYSPKPACGAGGAGGQGGGP